MFGSRRKRQLPQLISDKELDLAIGLDFDSVLEYLTGLSGDDYTKICQVAAVYREADFQAFKVLGLELAPTTYINKQDDVTDPATAESIADQMLDDVQPKSKAKKVTVK